MATIAENGPGICVLTLSKPVHGHVIEDVIANKLGGRGSSGLNIFPRPDGSIVFEPNEWYQTIWITSPTPAIARQTANDMGDAFN